MRPRWAISLGLLAAAGAAIVGSVGATPGAEVIKLTHQGIDRTAVLHAPQPGGARPLVVALHGQGGTGENFRQWAGLDAVADREGFVALYPDAVDGRWSYGRPINQPMPTIGTETVDDTGFLRRLLDDLVVRKIADPARIYVFGVSRGGLMAFTAACALDDVIAAAAPVLTGMTEPQRDDCKPARAVPLVVLAGMDDPVQSYGGAPGLVARLLSVPETMEFWRDAHGCKRPAGTRLAHRERDDPTRVVLVVWQGCRTEGAVRLYRVEGGGHQLPSTTGQATPLIDNRFGRRNRDIETAAEVWAFFQRFTR